MMQCNLRLATRRNGQRDGELMLVSPSGERWAPAGAPTPTLQALLDQWAHQAPALARRCSSLDASGWQGCAAFDPQQCLAPLPRAYQWADASVYRNHARLIYQWRQEPIPPRYEEEPLVYQGGSDVMLSGTEPIVAGSKAPLARQSSSTTSRASAEAPPSVSVGRSGTSSTGRCSRRTWTMPPAWRRGSRCPAFRAR